MSNETGAIFIPKNESTNTNRFCVNLKNEAPAWATHFRYFIKETSGEYYNLAADRIYNDEENGFSYISFPSTERNKVTEEHYLLLKKNHGDNNPCEFDNNRFKIIDISAEPPEFITNRKKAVISFADVVFTDDYSGSGGGSTITNKTNAENNSPIKDFASIQIKKVNGSNDGVPLTDSKEIKGGRYISFEYLGKESKAYKIKRLSQHPDGDNEIKIDFEEPFGEDVHVIYNKSSGNLGDASTNFGVNMTVLEEFSAAGDKEFDGRFFVKLKTNSALIGSIIKQEVGGKEYLAKDSINLIGIYSSKDVRGDSRRKGRNGYENANRGKTNAAGKKGTDPRNDFVVSHGGTATPGSKPETGQRQTLGSLEYNISLEQATWRLTHKADRLLKLAKVGNFVRFTKQDNTPHHDAIYEIGQVTKEKFRRGFGGSNRRDYIRINFRFIDEDGNFRPLEQNVCTRGEDTWQDEVQMEILQELDEAKTTIKDPAIFETEPLESKTELNIYFEASDILPISKHNDEIELDWFNAICFKNGVESNRIRDDFNATFMDNGVKASTVLDQPFLEEHKFNGIIFSGIINSRSGVNKTNEFNMANPITKDLLPSYGSIQKLHAWDDSLVILCEDKTLRVLANKSALYNADGSSNLISDARVLGDPIEYNGDYGISTNPESFASHGFRCYFADRTRGSVLRLSKNGLTPISSNFMGSFFRNRLFSSGLFRGSYDPRNGLYNLSFDDQDTVCFSEDVNGWVSRLSFIPENSVYLNNMYYTYNLGELWQHYSNNALYNNFYGTQYPSFVELIINDDPSVIKKFKTLGYEGSSGWVAKTLKTDQVVGNEATFLEKENKYFANITQDQKTINTLDNKNFSTQGIGRSVAAGANSYVDQVGTQTFDKFNVKIIDGTSWSSNQKNDIIIKQDKSIDDIQITLIANKSYDIDKSFFTSSSDLITFENSLDDVIITVKGTYLESLSPTNGQTINITISGRVVLTPVSVSGNYSVSGFNFTDDVGNGTYKITEDPGTTQLIKTRIITPDAGYSLKQTDVTIDNALIKIDKQTLGSGDIKVTETLDIPSTQTIGQDYVITVKPEEIIIPDLILFSSSLETSVLDNDGETRELIIHGQIGAEYEVVFLDGSSIIKTDEILLDKNKFETELIFPAGDTAKTYTVNIKTKDGTTFDPNFGVETYTITRAVRTRNNITFALEASDVMTSAELNKLGPVDVSGYGNDQADIDFKISLTLNGTGYSIKKTPVFDDVEYSTNQTGTNIVFSNFVLTTATNDTIVLEGKITSDNFKVAEGFVLKLGELLQKNVTVTIAYSATIAGGSATSNYSTTGFKGVSIPYTITAPANKVYGTIRNYYFTHTASSNKEPKKNFTNIEPFRLYDSSNNDVTDQYCEGGRIQFASYPSASTPTLDCGFKNVSFKMPSTNQTLTIRPKEEIMQAQTGVPTWVLVSMGTYINAIGFTKTNGGANPWKNERVASSFDTFANQAGITSKTNFPNYRIKTTGGWNLHVSSKINGYRTGNWNILDATAGNKLIQNILTIPDNLYYWWDANLSDTNKYDITNLGTYFTKATSGSYTDVFGDTKTVSSTFELSDDRKTLTINMLYNFNNVSLGREYFEPLFTGSVVNDIPNVFNTYQVKYGANSTHMKNDCSLILDDKVPFKTAYSPDSDLTDNSILFTKDNENNHAITHTDYQPIYIKDNNTLAYPKAVTNYVGGHYTNHQVNNYLKFNNTQCKVNVDYPDVEYRYHMKQFSTSTLGGYMYGIKVGVKADTALANKKIKIKGQYLDQRYGGFSNISTNNNSLIPEKLLVITTTQYPKGIPPTKAVENMHIEGFKITDTTKNTWEAEVQLNNVAVGDIFFKIQYYSNVNCHGLWFRSDQIKDGGKVDTRKLYDITTSSMTAIKPEPIFVYDRKLNKSTFQGAYKNWKDFPENSNYPSLFSINVGDENATESSQWTNPYMGEVTKLNINE